MSREKPRRAAYEPGILGEPGLEALFARTHRLHPIRELLHGKGRLTVVFERPVPWPLFLRLDLAKPLAGRACRLARSCGPGVSAVTLSGGALKVRAGQR